MPNHVTTELTCSPEVARTILRHPTTEEIVARPWDGWTKSSWVVDFALIIPPPEDYINEGCSHRHPLRFLGESEDDDPYRNCWYVWNRKHWGTKWNGYEPQISASEGDHAVLRFQTAWTHPVPVIDKLSSLFPREAIAVRYADEDLGSNCGAYAIRHGVVTGGPLVDGSEEARELGAQLLYGQSYADVMAEWANDDVNISNEKGNG